MKLPPTLVQMRHPTPLGDLVLAASPRGLVGAWFVQGQRHLPPAADFARWAVDDAHPILVETARQLDAYFAAQRMVFDLPYDLSGGTKFQQRVWSALLGIGCGQVSSYGAISRQIGNPQAMRAVGAAVGQNPISIIVPCHRVLGADGSLTGYAGGLARKVALLRLEGHALDAHPLSGETIRANTRRAPPPPHAAPRTTPRTTVCTTEHTDARTLPRTTPTESLF